MRTQNWLRKEHNFHSIFNKMHIKSEGNNYVTDSGQCFMIQRLGAMAAVMMALVAMFGNFTR